MKAMHYAQLAWTNTFGPFQVMKKQIHNCIKVASVYKLHTYIWAQNTALLDLEVNFK